ncbi:MAG TPA: hypothetical protein VF498_20295, partial [Anaerolineales bacterium]
MRTSHFPLPSEPNPAWLTNLLHDSGVLPSGVVAAIEITPTGAFNSRTGFIRLCYSADAPLSAPTRLVFKSNTPAAWSIIAGADEVHFYRLAAELADHPRVIPPCCAAEYDRSSGESFLLLQDLSETHAPPITRSEQISILRGMPLAVYQQAVIDTLAAFHGYWWDHALLSSGEFEVGYWSRD